MLETSINLRQCLTIGTGKRIDLRLKTFTFCKKKKCGLERGRHMKSSMNFGLERMYLMNKNYEAPQELSALYMELSACNEYYLFFVPPYFSEFRV